MFLEVDVPLGIGGLAPRTVGVLCVVVGVRLPGPEAQARSEEHQGLGISLWDFGLEDELAEEVGDRREPHVPDRLPDQELSEGLLGFARGVQAHSASGGIQESPRQHYLRALAPSGGPESNPGRTGNRVSWPTERVTARQTI